MIEKNQNQKFCHECGELINLKAEICPKCGVRQPANSSMAPAPASLQISMPGQGQPRVKSTAALLAILLGGLGMHKFYMGQFWWGVIYIVFIWTLIPAIIGLIEGLNYLLMSEKVFQERYGGQAWTKSP